MTHPGWQPADTAPKGDPDHAVWQRREGRRVLVKFKGGYVTIAHLGYTLSKQRVPVWLADTGYRLAEDPKWWMDLPE